MHMIHCRRFLLSIGLVALAASAPSVARAALVSPAPGKATVDLLTIDPAAKADLAPAIEALARRDYDECARQLNAAAEKHPGLPPSRLLMAKLFLSEGQVPAARTLLEQAASEAEDDPRLYVTLGNAALLEGRFADAMVHFEKAKGMLAGSKLPGPEKADLEADCNDGLATVWEQRQKWSLASEALQAVLASRPESANALARYGRTLFHLGKVEEALAQLRKAAAVDKELSPAGYIAVLYAQTGDVAKADLWFAKSIAEDPKNPQAHLGLARWKLQQERYDEARKTAEEALALDPGSPTATALLGAVALHQKKFEEAEKIFEELSRKNPGDLNLSNQLTLALAEQMDTAKQQRALQFAEMNARQYPRSPEALATLGRVYYRLGRTEEAERALEASVSLNRTRATADTAYYLAFVYADKGQLDKVRELLSKAVAARGAFIFRQEAKEWLERMSARP